MEDTGCERAEGVFSVAWHFLVLHFQVRRVIFGAGSSPLHSLELLGG